MSGKRQRAMASIWCCGMVVLLISFFLRPKESLHPVCQLQAVGSVAAFNPSEALSLQPYYFKFCYIGSFPALPFRSSNRKASIGSVATLPQNLRFRPAAGAEIFLVESIPNPLLFASPIIRWKCLNLPAIMEFWKNFISQANFTWQANEW